MIEKLYKDKIIRIGFRTKMKLFVASLIVGLALGAPQNSKKDLETVPYTVVATHHAGDSSVSKINTVIIF